MKKIMISVIIVISHYVANAQIGIFKTYEDYLSNKVIEYADYSTTYHVFGNFKVVFLDEDDKKIKIDVDRKSMWGYRRGNGEILRIDNISNPYLIFINGKIVVYLNYTTQINVIQAEMRANQFVPLISLGLNGEMIKLHKKNLKKILEGDEVALLQLKKTRNYYQALIDFIVDYNNNNISQQ